MTVSWYPYPGLPCITPLGPAMALGLDNDTANQEWVTVMDNTGENFNWGPEDIRFNASVSNRRREPSPFGRPNAKLQRQIDRYKANGWL